MTDQQNSSGLQRVTQKIGEICEKLKHTFDGEQCYEFVFTIFLWKYMSDQDFRVPKGTSYYEIFERRFERKLGQLVDSALETVSKYNDKDIRNLFQRVNFESVNDPDSSNCYNNRVKELLEELNVPELDMKPIQFLDDAVGAEFRYWLSIIFPECLSLKYENYIAEIDTGREKADKVTKILGTLSEPTQNISIPNLNDHKNVGIADTLSLKHSVGLQSSVEQDNLSVLRSSLKLQCWNAKEAGTSKEIEFHSFDRHRTIWALAWLSMLNGASHQAQIVVREFFTERSFHAQKEMDLSEIDNVIPIVSNIPERFASKPFLNIGQKSYKERSDNTFQTDKTLEWLEQLISSVKEQMRSEVVFVPSELLYETSCYRAIRKKLVTENLLKFVIGLPSNLDDGIRSTTILVLDVSRVGSAPNLVTFIDSNDRQSSIFETEIGLEDSMSWFEACYMGFNNENFSYCATAEEIAENGYDLSVSRYITPSQIDQRVLVKREETAIEGIVHKITKLNLHINENIKRLEQKIIECDAVSKTIGERNDSTLFPRFNPYPINSIELLQDATSSIKELTNRHNLVDSRIRQKITLLKRKFSA